MRQQGTMKWNCGPTKVAKIANFARSQGPASHGYGLLLIRPDFAKGTIDAFTGPGFDLDRENAIRSGAALALWNRWTEHTSIRFALDDRMRLGKRLRNRMGQSSGKEPYLYFQYVLTRLEPLHPSRAK